MLWTVTSEDTNTGKRTVWTANVLVHATGIFNRGKVLAIPGLSDFKGEVWHTLDWPANAKLEGKRVAVIGTGPSSVQVIPAIQPIVKSLTVYQRSLAYCMPRNEKEISGFTKFIFKYVPFAQYLYSLALYWLLDFPVYRMFRPANPLSEQMKKRSYTHLENQVKSVELREKLRGNGNFGCQRVLVSDDYYPAFEKPNVELITDPPIRITESGIISKPVSQLRSDERNEIERKADTTEVGGMIKKEVAIELGRYKDFQNVNIRNVDVDVIIWGTGFVVQEFGGFFRITGRSGQPLNEHWKGECNALFGTI
jgi:cation diffusion facilitator CzcD-associated flavoprotein CzcO